jgi:hypothetical protein
MDSATGEPRSFMKYVFRFDEEGKGEMVNTIQYAVLALVPIVMLNKLVQRFVPDIDEDKGSIEVLVEVVIQIIVTFIGLLFINRLVTFVPTYSGVDYPEFSIIYVILAVMLITLSLQTKLGKKVNLLAERFLEMFDQQPQQGKQQGQQQQGQVRISQPIAGQALHGGPLHDSTPLSQLPTVNYDGMYRGDSNPLVAAKTPGDSAMMGGMAGDLMPANMGGMGGGVW